MITKHSKLREILDGPIGRDLVQTLLAHSGLPEAVVNNAIVGNLSLSALQTLSGGKLDDGFVDALVSLLNSESDVPPVPPSTVRKAWWKEAVVYQIYPRSFADANGDGVGDLQGILSKLPYLKRLGVTMLWLSPIYDSPNDDGGYDIRDYQKIMAEFGTMQDFDALLEAVHANGMKLIMDLVVNHTSDEHAWFQSACQSEDDPCHDYYIWRKGRGADGTQPPNNWGSFFSGGAWNYVPKLGKHALHLFSKKQMDLNWDNAAMRRAVYDMMNWWFEKGVDGFRMDVINLISKSDFEDASPLLGQISGVCGFEKYFYGPRLHRYLREMRTESFGKYDTFTVGETPGIGMEMAKLLTAESRGELDTVFHFDHLDMPGKNRYAPYAYDLHYLKDYLLRWQQAYGNNCWQSLFYDNHDNPRMAAKVTQDPALIPYVAKLLGVWQFTLKGTPFVYQGQELGLPNARFHAADELRDIEARNRYAALLAQGMSETEAFAQAACGTRDHARTPMPWTSEPQAGFTKGTPWLKLTDGWETRNATAQMQNKGSVWHCYKALIALRKEHSGLVYGAFRPVFTKRCAHADVLCYFRVDAETGRKYYVESNVTGHPVKRPAALTSRHSLLLSTYGTPAVLLRPYEANVYEIKPLSR